MDAGVTWASGILREVLAGLPAPELDSEPIVATFEVAVLTLVTDSSEPLAWDLRSISASFSRSCLVASFGSGALKCVSQSPQYLALIY